MSRPESVVAAADAGRPGVEAAVLRIAEHDCVRVGTRRLGRERQRRRREIRDVEHRDVASRVVEHDVRGQRLPYRPASWT